MNEQLAELARERAARRRAAGVPPAESASATRRFAARSPNVTLPDMTVVLKCAGVVVLAWMVIARMNQGSCGCGPDGAKRMMDRVTGVEEGGGASVKVKVDMDTALKGMGDAFRGLTDAANELASRCKSPVTSAVCTTACWQTGSDLQQQMWSSCFRSWLRGEDVTRSSGQGGDRNDFLTDFFTGAGGAEL